MNMLEKIKHSIKHTAIYSIGNVSTKFIGVILLPLYTQYISVSEYGILAIIEITIFILTQFLSSGLPSAYLRFHDIKLYLNKRKILLFNSCFFLLITSVCIILIGEQFFSKIALYFSNPKEFEVYFRLSLYIIIVRIVNNLFLSVLRSYERSVFYVTVHTIKIFIILSLNVYFIAFLHLGINGILYAYLIGDSILFILLLPNMISNMEMKFNYKISREMIFFGFPLIFVGLAHLLLNMSNRYVLKLLVNYEEVGLFSLGYKIAGILNVLLIQSFTLGFLPAATKIFGQKDDKRYFSKTLTYFVYILIWTGLALAMFSEHIVKFFALNENFLQAYTVIPVIILAFIFSGAKSVTMIGFYLYKKTQYIAYITIFALFVNISLSFLLIPTFGMMGAAYATLISFIILFFLSYHFSNKFYKIPWENIKLVKMLFLSIILFLISEMYNPLNSIFSILLKSILLFLFPIILYWIKFYEPIEIETINRYKYKFLLKIGLIDKN